MIVLGASNQILLGQTYSPPTNIIDSLERFYAPGNNNNTPSPNGAEGDYEFMERELEMWGARLYGSNGDFTEALAAYKDYATTFGAGASCAQGASPQTNDWKSIGPQKYTGQIHNIVFDPHFNEANHPDNQTIYACAPYGGLWRTTDGGTLWEQVNTDYQLPIASVIDMCINPNDNKTLFVATGLAVETEYFSPYRLGNVPIFTGGVYRSFDKGLTWEAINDGLLSALQENGGIRDILMNPDNPNDIFLATTEGVFRTENALAVNPIWSKVFVGDYNDDFFALEFKYKEMQMENPILLLSGKSYYTFNLSTNNWQNISAPINSLYPLGLLDILNNSSIVSNDILRTNLAVTPHFEINSIGQVVVENRNKLYANIITKTSSAVYRSIFIYDFTTETWIKKTDDIMLNSGYMYKLYDIAVNPTNGEHVVVAEIYPKRCSNFLTGGFPATFSYFYGNYSDIRCFIFEPNASTPRLFGGDDDGVLYWSNPSTANISYTYINDNLDIDMVISLDDSEHDREVIIAGYQDHHTFGKHFNTITQNYEWKDISGGGDGYKAAIDDATGKYFYFAINSSEYTDFVTKNGITLLNNVSDITYAIDPYSQNPVGSIYMINHPQTDKMIWGSLEMQSRNYPIAGANTATALWDVESDIGANYGDINSPTTPFLMNKRGVIRKMVVSPSNPDIVYIALGGEYANLYGTQILDYPPRLFKSTEGLCNDVFPTVPDPKFIDITNKLPTFGPQNKVYCISDIVIDPNNPDKIWISFMSYQQDYKIFKSTDGGVNWINDDPNNSLCNLPINTMAYQDGSHDRIFIGMDNGVFYKDANMTDWERYGNKLPNIRITSMKINSCAGIMRVGTWGRGIWEVDLPYNDRLQTEKLLTQNETWQPELIYNPNPNITTDDVYQTEKALRSNLRIQSGVTLTIKDFTVGMPKYGMIYVEPGAKLILDNSKITNLCGEMWGGIEVMGNAAFPQEPDANGNYLQGYVNISNNSVVENAHTAITTDYLYGSGQFGGIVQARNSAFLNNQRSVAFMKYHNADFLGNPLPNRSYFSDCNFLIDNDYRGDVENVPFKAHITAWNIEGLNITKCNFENAKTTGINYAQDLGTGIYTIDAGFSVKGHCDYTNVPAPGTNPPCPFEDIEPSVFKNLYYGIRADNEGSMNTYTVHGCRFENNIRGIESNGVDFPSILQNQFLVGGNPYLVAPANGAFPIHEGIIINTGSSYRIEENRMEEVATSGAFRYTIGTRANNTGTAPNQLYRNDYNGLYIGNLANRNNVKILFPFTGLQYLCNTHTNDYADIAVITSGGVADGIRKAQGDPSPTSTIDAGNTFSQNADFPEDDYFDNALSLTYYYTSGTHNPINYSTSTITKKFRPNIHECLTNNHVGLGDNTISGSEISTLKTQFYITQTEYISLLYTYEQLIDEGNTSALVQNITQTWSDDAWILRSQLLARSPYLSEEAIRKAILQDILPQAMIFELCLANPDVLRNDRFLTFLATEISTPLPQYMISALKSASITGSVRTVLENSLMQAHTEMAEIGYPLIRNMLNDTTGYVTDTLAVWLTNLNALPYQYTLAELYYDDLQTVNALSTLTTISAQFKLNEEELAEHQNYTDLMNLKLVVRESNRTLAQLNANEIADLTLIRDASESKSGIIASNILCFYYGLCKEYPAILPNTTQQRQAANPASVLSESAITLAVYPNPATEYVTFDYRLAENKSSVFIEITDISGKIIDRLPCSDMQGKILWDTRKVSTGVYLYVCKEGSQTLAAGKLSVQH